MTFDFKDVKEQPRLRFVGFGVNEPVVVSDVEADVSQSGTPNIAIKLKFETETEDKNSTTIRLWFSEKAKDIAMRKILHLHKAIGKEEQIKQLKVGTLAEMAQALKTMWINRPFRLKLTGEEYMGVDKDGAPKVKVRLNIPFPPFAEPLGTLAEAGPVSKEESKLSFNKANSVDYKPLDASQVAPLPTEGGVKSDTTAEDDFDLF